MSEACDRFALSPLDWRMYWCASAAEQPHWTPKFALPKSGDCILPSYIFPWDQAVTQHSSLCCLILCEIGNMISSPPSPTPEHVPGALWRKDSTTLLSPSGESHPEGAVCTMCTLLAINPYVLEESSGNLSEKGSSANFVLTKDREEGGN